MGTRHPRLPRWAPCHTFGAAWHPSGQSVSCWTAWQPWGKPVIHWEILTPMRTSWHPWGEPGTTWGQPDVCEDTLPATSVSCSRQLRAAGGGCGRDPTAWGGGWWRCHPGGVLTEAAGGSFLRGHSWLKAEAPCSSCREVTPPQLLGDAANQCHRPLRGAGTP